MAQTRPVSNRSGMAFPPLRSLFGRTRPGNRRQLPLRSIRKQRVRLRILSIPAWRDIQAAFDTHYEPAVGRIADDVVKQWGLETLDTILEYVYFETEPMQGLSAAKSWTSRRYRWRKSQFGGNPGFLSQTSSSATSAPGGPEGKSPRQCQPRAGNSGRAAVRRGLRRGSQHDGPGGRDTTSYPRRRPLQRPDRSGPE